MTQPVSTQPMQNQNVPGQPARQDGLVRIFPLRHRKLRNTIAIPIGIILILMAILALLYGAFITWTAVERFGRAVILKTSTHPIGCLHLWSHFRAAYPGKHTKRHWHDGIELSPSGLTFQKGKSRKEVPWESITRLDARISLVKFATSVIDVQSKAEIETDQGETFQITDKIDHSQDLINRCREVILPRLYQKYQHSLRQGEKITFHPELAATAQALLIRNMPYFWQDIEPKFKKRKIALQEKSSAHELIALPLNQLKNADILLTLLENPPRGS